VAFTTERAFRVIAEDLIEEWESIKAITNAPSVKQIALG
jgi:hypothetical protein